MVLRSEEMQKLIATYYREGISGPHLVIALERLFERFSDHHFQSIRNDQE
jgi:hypothetical protein